MQSLAKGLLAINSCSALRRATVADSIDTSAQCRAVARERLSPPTVRAKPACRSSSNLNAANIEYRLERGGVTRAVMGKLLEGENTVQVTRVTYLPFPSRITGQRKNNLESIVT